MNLKGSRQIRRFFGSARLRILCFAMTAALLAACGGKSWTDIQKRGVVRVAAAPPPELHGLPRGVSQRDAELSMLEAFAQENGLRLERVDADRASDLPAMLEDGRADVVVGCFSDAPEYRTCASFTVPVFRVARLIVVPKDMFAVPKSPRILLPRGRGLETCEPLLRKMNPDAKIEFADLDPEDALVLVGEGSWDMTVVDSNVLASYRRYRDDVKILHGTPPDATVPTTWAVRKNAAAFRNRLNRFIQNNRTEFSTAHHADDLSGIRKRRMLRVVTRDSPVNYYSDREELQGFEYELARRFAERIGVDLVMVVPTGKEDPLDLLTAGDGDIVACGMPYAPSLASRKDVACSVSYVSTRDVLVQSADKEIPQTFEGRTVLIHRDSPYYETLLGLQSSLRFQIEFASPALEEAEIIQSVAQGENDLWISSDMNVDNAILRGGVEVQALALAASRPKDCVWVVRAGNPELKKAVDDFFREECQNRDFQILFRSYFGDPAWRSQPAASAQPFLSEDEFYSVAGAEEASESRKGIAASSVDEDAAPSKDKIPEDVATAAKEKTPEPKRAVSRFDSIIKRHAEGNGFDWRLIAAVIRQESRFRPRAVARDGGKGLMQLMPATMREMDCSQPFNPEENIRAGVEYLAKQRAKLPDSIQGDDRICFALASYNCGYGHVLDARRIARDMKLNPDKWFDNVEKAMNLLKIRRYYSRTRYGYCQSGITIRYVREIMKTWKEYAKAFPPE